ncbi:lipopolysaccharide transport periplasmic protein LptA [Candidatus Spongiihabitans sp.]|uniref:lipopolysaccharide transport periplasmic protein LptA n=1 Tax=Candidatus Spongiihabitans sp. TaxID=3101308 RepID=UPI003C7E606A
MLNRLMLSRLMVGLLMGVFCQAGYALDSDSEQPVTLTADDFEIDLNTGVRVYRGNVVFRQGSIKLTCDALTTYFNDDDDDDGVHGNKLNKSVCIGRPGIFMQRPEGSEADLVGSAMEITMDEIENLVTLKNQAKVVHGGSTITAPMITYNRLTEKAFVTGGASSENARPSLTIQPREKAIDE